MVESKILIVDDDQSILEALEMLLSGYGYLVDTALNGRRALEKLTPDTGLILADIRMPKMDGLEMTQCIKADPYFKHIPVLIFSANNNLEQAKERAQADGVISKPFDVDEMIAIVEKHLN